MFSFTPQQRQQALIWLCLWHMSIIAASNILVQFPFSVMGIHTTWGALSFPFIFLTTDLTVRIFGASLARKIIFLVMFPALALSYLISVAFNEGELISLSQLTSINWFVARIAIASFAAYLLGQLLDITVFNYLRRHAKWWVAPATSTVLGNILDTIVFFSIAFWRSSDTFMAAHWQAIAFVDYLFKLTICALFFLPAYGLLLKILTQKLTTLRESDIAKNLAKGL